MDRSAIIVRVAALLIAAGLALGLVELWAVASSIMGNYFATVSKAPQDQNNGVITVRVLPVPETSPSKPPAAEPAEPPPAK